MSGLRSLPLLAALVGLLVMASAGNATDYCKGNGNIVAIGNGESPTVYVTADALDGDHMTGPQVWGYLEANGEQGLQRGGLTMLGDPDICQDTTNPDQGIF